MKAVANFKQKTYETNLFFKTESFIYPLPFIEYIYTHICRYIYTNIKYIYYVYIYFLLIFIFFGLKNLGSTKIGQYLKNLVLIYTLLFPKKDFKKSFTI